MADDGATVSTRSEPFDAVPCWLRELGLQAWSTYAALLNFNRHAGCFPSVAALAERSMLSERATRAALRVLERAGAIQTERSKGRTSSTYTLLADRRDTAPAAALDGPTRQDVQVPTRQDVPPISDEDLGSQTDEPNGSSESVRGARSRSMLDEPGQSADVDAVCEALADHVEKVLGRSRPDVTKGWRRSARLMLDGPGDKPAEWRRDQLEYAIRWLASPNKDAQFWSVNVMSMDALRRQMFRLEAAIKREHRERTTNGQPRQTLDDLQAMALRARARDQAKAS